MKNKYSINKGFITQKIGDKTTIFEGEESILHTLNDTAAYIFQGIKLQWDEEKIINGLVEKFGASRKEAEKDLVDFIELLKKKKIILEKE